jgi:hypothetical protein
MSYEREEVRARLLWAVDEFLNMIEAQYVENEEYEECDIISFGIVAEVDWTDEEVSGSSSSYWFSNENRIFQRGFFGDLADSLRIAIR